MTTHSQKQHCLVTGGSGFLGKHLVEQLLDTGKCEVTVFDIRDLGDSRVKCTVGDLRELDGITKACAGESELASVLCCAVLCCAVLRCAVLCCAVLRCAVLCCAVLGCVVKVTMQQHWGYVRCNYKALTASS